MKISKSLKSLKSLTSISSSNVKFENLQSNNDKAQIINHHHDYLLDLLLDLDEVIQSPKYHPESDALYHSLQVFDLAYNSSTDPELWLAALFHDVGKSVDSKLHAEIGAEMLTNIFPERVVWLIEHHLDLLISPRKTKQHLSNTQQLQDLVKLRKWDLAGRSTTAEVRSPHEALSLTLSALFQTK